MAPKHLSAASRCWYDEVLADYELEPQHVRLLQLAAESWDECQAARKLLEREGLVIRDRFEQAKAHPAVAIERDARIAFARLVRELDLEGVPGPSPRPPGLRRN